MSTITKLTNFISYDGQLSLTFRESGNCITKVLHNTPTQRFISLIARTIVGGNMNEQRPQKLDITYTSDNISNSLLRNKVYFTGITVQDVGDNTTPQSQILFNATVLHENTVAVGDLTTANEITFHMQDNNENDLAVVKPTGNTLTELATLINKVINSDPPMDLVLQWRITIGNASSSENTTNKSTTTEGEN